MNKRLLVRNAVFLAIISAVLVILMVAMGVKASKGIDTVLPLGQLSWWISAGVV